MSNQPERRPKRRAPDGLPDMRGMWPGLLPLLAGAGLALLVGWAVFPQILYTSQAQPLDFSHVTHLEEAGLDCRTCHFLRVDGSFAGLPELARCAECHSTPLGKSPEEARLISEYIAPGKEIPWLSYAGQPGHVFFSHAAHSLARCNACHKFSPEKLCASCHQDMSTSTALPAYKQDRITGYGQDIVSMESCERCHALPGHAQTTASTTCATCHT